MQFAKTDSFLFNQILCVHTNTNKAISAHTNNWYARALRQMNVDMNKKKERRKEFFVEYV